MVFDAEFNDGTKALNYTGIKRMNALAEWVMQRPEDTVVCVGHSLYFRSFFRVRRGQKKGVRAWCLVSFKKRYTISFVTMLCDPSCLAEEDVPGLRMLIILMLWYPCGCVFPAHNGSTAV